MVNIPDKLPKRSRIFCRIRSLDEQGGRAELIQRSEKVASNPRHVMQEFLMGVSDRSALFTIDGKTHRFDPGDILFLNPGQNVSYQTLSIPRQGTTYRGVNISPELMGAVSYELKGLKSEWLHFSRPVLKNSQLTETFHELNEMLLNGRDEEEVRARLLHLMDRIAAKDDGLLVPSRLFPRKRLALRRVLDYLHENHAKGVTVNDLARQAKLSDSRLSHVFSKEVGVSPHAYLIQYRVNKAQSYLAQGMSPAQVALETGFVDQAHLTRHFKKYVALTPGKYARGSRYIQDTKSPLMFG
jgi:AraC-like DNA-binding protein